MPLEWPLKLRKEGKRMHRKRSLTIAFNEYHTTKT